MLPHAAVNRIEALRTHRVRPERAVLAGAEASRVLGDLRRSARGWSGLEEALRQGLPQTLAERCEVVSFDGGVARVRVPDHASRYLLDRWLRSGGVKALRGAGAGGLKRVQILV